MSEDISTPQNISNSNKTHQTPKPQPISIIDIPITIYLWTVATIATLTTAVVCIISYPFVDQKTFSRIYEVLMGNIILKAMTIPGIWSLKMTDLRTPKEKRYNNRYIFVANHASFIDTILTSQIPSKKKFIMARIFQKIPIFGWLCKTAGHVPVNRRDKNSSSVALNRCVKTMEDGCSFMIYPEGQRSLEPYTVLPFKTGAFRLSQKTKVPILPIVLKGTAVGMRIGGICHPANLEVIIGHPIEVGPEWDDIKPISDQTREFIQEHLSVGINGESKNKIK